MLLAHAIEEKPLCCISSRHEKFSGAGRTTDLHSCCFAQVQVFDDSVEDDEPAMLCVGGRPHESEAAFLDFLETMFAVCFHKYLDAEKEQGPRLPLLGPYIKQVRRCIAEKKTFRHFSPC